MNETEQREKNYKKAQACQSSKRTLALLTSDPDILDGLALHADSQIIEEIVKNPHTQEHTLMFLFFGDHSNHVHASQFWLMHHLALTTKYSKVITKLVEIDNWRIKTALCRNENVSYEHLHELLTNSPNNQVKAEAIEALERARKHRSTKLITMVDQYCNVPLGSLIQIRCREDNFYSEPGFGVKGVMIDWWRVEGKLLNCVKTHDKQCQVITVGVGENHVVKIDVDVGEGSKRVGFGLEATVLVYLNPYLALKLLNRGDVELLDRYSL